MSSSIYDDPLRVSVTNLSHQSAQDETHYQHGIPGIPTDGKVVLLRNSYNGAQLYLVGTIHISKQSAEIVKKVIDNVTPDVVAVELCKGRAEGLMNWKPEDDTLYKLFCRSMRSPGGLCTKVVNFVVSCWYRRLHAGGIFPGLEFKVAMEESSRVGATCVYIDQDHNVTHQQLSKVSSYGLLWKAYTRLKDEVKKSRQMIDYINGDYTRSNVQEIVSILKIICPKITEVMIEDRDKFLFTNLRSFQGKVVAVVGMAHMDGIELLWKRAEEDDSKQRPLNLNSRVSRGHSE